MGDTSHHFQADHFGQTTVHPLALMALMLAAVLTLALPRRWALMPLLLLLCFVPQSQRIVFATLDFTFLRLMVLAGLARIVLLGEFRGFQLKLLDKMVIAWCAVELVLSTLSDGQGPARFVYYAGEIVQRLGLYFVCRVLIKGYADILRLTVGLAIISVPVAIAFVYEHFTAYNVFSVFGGVPVITSFREGRLRCQGAFAHPILAGCFWASTLPFMAAMWADKRKRVLSIIGLGCAVVIIVMCASSTPVFATLVMVLGMGLFHVRKHMRKLCWATVAVLFVLHMVMNAPVWHLLSRVSVVGGSTGWHRYSLIDKFINHWPEWLVRGSSRGTAHWGNGLFDVTNYYVIEGLRGGLPLLILFLVMLNIAFRSVGATVRAVEPEKNRLRLLLAWAAGVALAQHCANFIAVTYFGQINLIWCMTLAMIASLAPLKLSRRVKKRKTAPARRAMPMPEDTAGDPGMHAPPAGSMPATW